MSIWILKKFWLPEFLTKSQAKGEKSRFWFFKSGILVIGNWRLNYSLLFVNYLPAVSLAGGVEFFQWHFSKPARNHL